MEFKEKIYHHCSFCGFKCTDKINLESHFRVHTGERPYFCDQCKRGFSSKFQVKKHTLRVHQGIKEEREKKYKCSLCPYATNNTGAFNAHTQRYHENRTFPCQHPDCQYTGKSLHYLRKHFATVHKTKKKRKFLCQFPTCDFRANTMGTMRTHLSRTHTENRPFICDFEGCSYRAKVNTALVVHQLGVHHGGHKPFACSVCNYCAASKNLLRDHELTHSEKLFKCSFSGCTFSCKLKKYLYKHVLNRHKERTLKCDFEGCSSTAANQCMLNQHRKIAHGEKIYKCPSCDYRTADKSTLWKHIVTHEARRRIPCPREGCNFLTTHPQYLRQHMRHHKSCLVEGCSHVSHSSSSWKSRVGGRTTKAIITNEKSPVPKSPIY